MKYDYNEKRDFFNYIEARKQPIIDTHCQHGEFRYTFYGKGLFFRFPLSFSYRERRYWYEDQYSGQGWEYARDPIYYGWRTREEALEFLEEYRKNKTKHLRNCTEISITSIL